MLIAMLLAAQAISPSAGPVLTINPVGPNAVCPAENPNGIIVEGGKVPSAGIIVQGGLRPSADAGIIVQGGKTANTGIIVQGGLQPSAAGGPADPSAKATAGKCGKPKL